VAAQLEPEILLVDEVPAVGTYLPAEMLSGSKSSPLRHDRGPGISQHGGDPELAGKQFT
jgi:hypothetical protein